ncbi:protein-methionine-sulfoxide reductase catalytic subunit MsrP [Prochlorothrix hollandica]|uniref:Oxidoreductase n=1 Tax=Prochlorothrix hollandica PCC 9006 = CALU 1027 TaxID=317619 RepID=A0A0M2Q4U7_PROHO|nr:protein-methionine-sulfoxide reductase catalytic subunit MsrP [Prochlorothrix hollandica]KKJ01607.1 oxidoreductase [Prochlorothrix hollandica PCC 9006 = CALU 1027]
MVLFRIAPDWQLPERAATSEAAYVNRRQFLRVIGAAGLTIAAGPLSSCRAKATDTSTLEASLDLPQVRRVSPNPEFADLDRPLTDRLLAGQYNNYYEFGGTKSIWAKAQTLPTDPWTLTVGGLVKNPATYDRDDLMQKFPLEERLYRFRCVEAWSMALPWLGFPMRLLLEAAEPLPEAQYVRFTSYYQADITPGPGVFSSFYPWPYTEALRLDEMANELAFFAVGLYGRLLPKQHGAPIRAVIPWKYGFKGAKSIVGIEFTAEKPATFWNTVQANEYAFESNVDPKVPHPRWSQSQERFISTGPDLSWEMRPTLPYNGYESYVAGLYA